MPKNKHYKRPGPFVMIHKEILESPAYRNLKPVSRCLLQEFQCVHLPSRNGQLSISTRNAVKLLNVSEPTAMKAFDELVSHGFIILKNPHSWTQGKAREYALTFMPINGREPTDEWKDWDSLDPYPIPGRKKFSTKKTGAELLNIQGQTAEKQGQ